MDFSKLNALLQRIQISQLAGPVLIMMVLLMMVLPLPALILDLLFTFNIALSIMVLMVSLYSVKPLDFSVFPSVLLITTLLRLSLNVASTRKILLEGHTGADAAGKVVEAFGHFLVGGNYAVGILLFIILTIINFVVITKGAGRIAEVSARFTLDAMPGKQMAIDADLNAGLIGEADAKRRRQEVAQEADFFGSMDGASKFVRGDAVAGILIMVLNIAGGLLVGLIQHNMGFADAASTYTLLTIGDGLVAQIPALIISTAAGMVVSRVGTGEDVSGQLISQLFQRRQALYITGAVLGILGLIPGMPHVAFLLMGASSAGLAYWLEERERKAVEKPETLQAPPPPTPEPQEVSWNDVSPVDVIGLEVGYRLIPLVDKGQDGELLRRIRGIRKKFAQEQGFLVPSVHIRDNLELRPNQYRLSLKGVEMGLGEAFVGMYLAINPGRVLGTLPGQPTQDPTFGLPAVWVDASQREKAQSLGYTVVDSSTVIGTHLSNILQQHAAELLGREEVQQLLEHLGREFPKLIDELVPKVIPLGVLHKVLQNLLQEDMHIRDMRTILETLAEHIGKTQEADDLTAQVRIALARAIVHQLYPGQQELQVMSLEPGLENLLLQAVQLRTEGTGLEPGLADRILNQAAELAVQMENQGLPATLLVPAPLRLLLSRFLRRAVPQMKILAHTEIPENRMIRVVAVLGAAPVPQH